VARGCLPSIQIFSNVQADDADLDAELASSDSSFSKHSEKDKEGASDAEWGSVPRKQELNCLAGRRRTRLSLSAYDLELSLEYARLLKVVQLVLTLLRTRKISTMRDVYYMDCRLFQSQTKSDRSIELLARCFNTPRYGLNIVSFSRGILCGAILLREKDGQWMDCSSSPVTMPSCMHTIEINADNTSAVFVLEKECIFRRLINDNFVERQYNGKALLVTACGFPDVQTRMLLNRLSSKYPALPIYGIADFDPYGELHPHPRVFLIALCLFFFFFFFFSLSLSLSFSLPPFPSFPSFFSTRARQSTYRPVLMHVSVSLSLRR
jgi:hypothetical protein